MIDLFFPDPYASCHCNACGKEVRIRSNPNGNLPYDAPPWSVRGWCETEHDGRLIALCLECAVGDWEAKIQRSEDVRKAEFTRNNFNDDAKRTDAR